MNRVFRIGLAGTGNIAHAHLAGYHSVIGKHAQVVAACDPRRQVLDTFCDQHDIPGRYPSVAAMLDSEEIDVLVVLTPPQVRDQILYPAFEAGVHVLVEKPFAETASAAIDYVRAAEEASCYLAVSQNFRWFPEYQWIKRQITDMGTIEFIEHRCFQDRVQRPGVWRAEQDRLEMAIFSVHLIDRIQWIANATPTHVSAITRRDRSGSLPGEQFTTLLVQFDGDLVAQMTSSWMSRALPTNEMRVDTVLGSITVCRPGPMSGDAVGQLQVRNQARQVAHFPDQDQVRHGTRTYGFSLMEFLEAIANDRESSHSGRNNLRTMAIMDAAYLSAARDGALVTTEEALGGHKPTGESKRMLI